MMPYHLINDWMRKGPKTVEAGFQKVIDGEKAHSGIPSNTRQVERYTQFLQHIQTQSPTKRHRWITSFIMGYFHQKLGGCCESDPEKTIRFKQAFLHYQSFLDSP